MNELKYYVQKIAHGLNLAHGLNRGLLMLMSFVLVLLLTNCSQQVSPTGGKKDIILPKLINSIPINKQTNYKSKTVELTFDEYIVVENLQQKLVITPDAGEYTMKLIPKGLRLKFEKDLDSNKTYSLSFGDAIKDFSEKNPAKNLKIVFSTGKFIDSASVAGKILDIQTSRPAFDALVGLYKYSDTLNPEKKKATYFTRTDSSGNFSIENIQPDSTYKLIAIDDKNRSMTYNPKAERIAYLKDSIAVKGSTQISGLTMSLFYANYLPIKYKNGSSKKPNSYELTYDRGIENYKILFQNKADSVPYFRSNTNELKLYNTKNSKDSIAIKVIVTDSLGNVVEKSQKIKFKDAKPSAKDKEDFYMEKSVQDNEVIEPIEIGYVMTFNKPLSIARVENIKFFSDSTKAEIIEPKDMVWENNKTKLTINKQFSAKKELKIVLPKSTFISIENDTIKAQILKFPIKDPENFGTLSGAVITSSTSFIIELLSTENKLIKTLRNQKEFKFEYLKPGEYSVRVINDINKNGKWDSGNYTKKVQPEPISFYPNIVKVRKNFEIEGINVELSTK